jgi:hypothetical protein
MGSIQGIRGLGMSMNRRNERQVTFVDRSDSRVDQVVLDHLHLTHLYTKTDLRSFSHKVRSLRVPGHALQVDRHPTFQGFMNNVFKRIC